MERSINGVKWLCCGEIRRRRGRSGRFGVTVELKWDSKRHVKAEACVICAEACVICFNDVHLTDPVIRKRRQVVVGAGFDGYCALFMASSMFGYNYIDYSSG